MKRGTWRAAAILGIVATLPLIGCSGGGSETRCEPSARYTTSESVGPVRIPDDLTPPDESDALQLPPASVTADAASAPPAGGCLETPPKFSRESGAQTRPAPAPAPAPSPDRQISN